MSNAKTELDRFEESARTPKGIIHRSACQTRVAIDRARFAIRQSKHVANQSVQLRKTSLQLLDAFDSLDSAERRFKVDASLIDTEQGTPKPNDGECLIFRPSQKQFGPIDHTLWSGFFQIREMLQSWLEHTITPCHFSQRTGLPPKNIGP